MEVSKMKVRALLALMLTSAPLFANAQTIPQSPFTLQTGGGGAGGGASECGDLSDAAASCSTDTTNADNISSGTLNTSLFPTTLTWSPTITGTVGVTGQLNVDNLRFDGNTISTTNTNGNLTLAPDGTGQVILATGFGFRRNTLDFGATVTGMFTDGSTGFGNISANGLYLKTGGNIASLISGSGALRARNHQDSAYTSLHGNDLQSWVNESRRLFAARTSGERVGLSSGATFGWSSTDDAEGTLDTTLVRLGASIIGPRNGSTGGAALNWVEQTAPAAPSTNGVHVYAQDSGGGKTQLCALFASGTAQCFATEP